MIIHLVLIPARADGLQAVLKPLHMRYAQRVNRARGWAGHLWQGRFFSSPLDDQYLWAAIRYVERNPVRAKLVRQAEQYPWSSAAAHCGAIPAAGLLCREPRWLKQCAQIRDWSAWLAAGDDAKELALLRRNSDKGLPCGAATFIKKLERLAGRILRYRPPHRPKKAPTPEATYDKKR